MIPLAVGAMLVKPLAKGLLDRLGYRNLLIGNTALLGMLIAGLATVDADTPYLLLLAHLGLIGVGNSLQFTAMNTVTLIGLSNASASSGNSLLSVVVQLSMSPRGCEPQARCWAVSPCRVRRAPRCCMPSS